MFNVVLTIISLTGTAQSFYPIFRALGGVIACPQRLCLPYSGVSPQGVPGSWTGCTFIVQGIPM